MLFKPIRNLQLLLGRRSNDADGLPDHAALTATGGQAADAWVHLTFNDDTTGVVCLQHKGQSSGKAVGERGGDTRLVAINLLGDIVALAGGQAPRSTKDGIVPRLSESAHAHLLSITKMVACELAHTKLVGRDLEALVLAQGVRPAHSNPTGAWDALQGMRLRDNRVPTMLLITRQQFISALGPVFGSLIDRSIFEPHDASQEGSDIDAADAAAAAHDK